MGRCFAVFALLVVGFVRAPVASADEMDVSLARLCQRDGAACADPDGDGVYARDDDAWRGVMTQLGYVLAPPLTSGARTTGFRHFYLGIETSVVQLDEGADYWANGTEGDRLSGVERRNRFVDSVMTLTRLHVRKGLPWGLELGLSAGRIFNTSYWTWGASLQISLMEGFREGLAAWIPDIAIRGSVQTLTGDDEFSLTVPSLDVVVSKPLVLGRAAVLTPIIGAQFMWIAADSESIDLSPGRDQWAECGNLIDRSGGSGEPWTLPSPACTGSVTDYGNETEFPQLRVFRSRLVVGFNFRYRLLQLGATIHWDLKNPSSDADVPAGVARQYNLTVLAGVLY